MTESNASITDKDLADRAPIFIIGSGRSGTTLMRYMLNAHPNIYIAEEICYHFWMSRFVGSFRQRLKNYFHSFSFAWLRVDPDKILASLPAELGERDFADVYRRILQTKGAEYGRGRWGEKGPLLTESLDRIFQDFPDARVIHVVRDPRSIVYSHITMPWSTCSLIAANRVVKDSLATVASHGDRILTVRLEDLVSAPEPTARRVLDFVGEPWSERVLKHAEHVLQNDGIPFPWLQEASRDRRHKKLAWSDVLSPAWIRLIETTHRDTMQHFGYAPVALPVEPSGLAKTLAVLADVPRLLYTAWRLMRLVSLFVVLPKDDTQRFQSLLHSLNPGAWALHPDWPQGLPSPPYVVLKED